MMALRHTRCRALARIYWLEARNECLRMWRTPSYVLPTLLFPLIFYVMFAILMQQGGARGSRYLLAGYGVFGVMAAAMFGFGVNIAIERGNGLMRLRRALPLPIGALLFARMAMALLFALLISLTLFLLAQCFTAAELSSGRLLWLLAVNLFGVLPFAMLGIFLGSIASSSGAPALINLVVLPMAFLSGLWLPLAMLPGWIGRLAPLWPSWHLAQLALKGVGGDAGHSPWLHAGVLLAVTALFAALAHWRLSRVQ